MFGDDGWIDPTVANQGARAGHWWRRDRERAKSFAESLESLGETGSGTEIELSVPPGAISYGQIRRVADSLWRKRLWIRGQHS